MFNLQTSGSGDRLVVTAGANTGGIELINWYGNKGAKTFDFNTEFLHVRWYTSRTSHSDGFTGYVQRLD